MPREKPWDGTTGATTSPVTSTSNRRLDLRDVDLRHLQHRFERALGDTLVRARDRVGQHARRDLPRQAPLVLAPAARAFLPAIADDRVPVAVRFGLVVGRDLERERFGLLELRAAVQADARDAQHV